MEGWNVGILTANNNLTLIQSYTTRRRYSAFLSLHQALTGLYPVLIIPPIPSKQAITDYAIKGQSKTKEDSTTIAKRKRLLEDFLRRIVRHPILGGEHIFHRFLEDGVSWVGDIEACVPTNHSSPRSSTLLQSHCSPRTPCMLPPTTLPSKSPRPQTTRPRLRRTLPTTCCPPRRPATRSIAQISDSQSPSCSPTGSNSISRARWKRSIVGSPSVGASVLQT